MKGAGPQSAPSLRRDYGPVLRARPILDADWQFGVPRAALYVV